MLIPSLARKGEGQVEVIERKEIDMGNRGSELLEWLKGESRKMPAGVYMGERPEVRRYIMASHYGVFLGYCMENQIGKKQGHWVDRYEKAIGIEGVVEVVIGDGVGSFAPYNDEMMRIWERLERNPRVMLKYATMK